VKVRQLSKCPRQKVSPPDDLRLGVSPALDCVAEEEREKPHKRGSTEGRKREEVLGGVWGGGGVLLSGRREGKEGAPQTCNGKNHRRNPEKKKGNRKGEGGGGSSSTIHIPTESSSKRLYGRLGGAKKEQTFLEKREARSRKCLDPLVGKRSSPRSVPVRLECRGWGGVRLRENVDQRTARDEAGAGSLA